MDWITGKEQISGFIKKYRYMFLILLIGIFLMSLPDVAETEQEHTTGIQMPEPDLQESLADFLSKVSGAGKVDVLLTELEGERTHYQVDEDISQEDVRRDTVVVTDANRVETGLVRQVDPPVYLGAVVLCQGADNAAVRLSIVEAVKSVTGLSSDRITVLKMK